MTLRTEIIDLKQDLLLARDDSHLLKNEVDKLVLDLVVANNRAKDFEESYNALRSRMDGYKEAMSCTNG